MQSNVSMTCYKSLRHWSSAPMIRLFWDNKCFHDISLCTTMPTWWYSTFICFKLIDECSYDISSTAANATRWFHYSVVSYWQSNVFVIFHCASGHKLSYSGFLLFRTSSWMFSCQNTRGRNFNLLFLFFFRSKWSSNIFMFSCLPLRY